MDCNDTQESACYAAPESPYDSLPHFINSDGQHIFTRCWEVFGGEKVVRALMLICHDVAEHCGRYEAIAEQIAARRIQVYAHDHVGHGQSEGVPVDIIDSNVYVKDTLQHVDILKEKHPYLPMFILGHGMGGTIAMLAAQARPKQFTGCVLVSPAIQPTPDQASSVSKFIDKTAASFLPLFGVGKIDPASLSSDPNEVTDYVNDPLVYHGRLRARHSVEIMVAMEAAESIVSRIKWPFYVLHGDDDKRCLVDGSKFLFENAKSLDKKIKIYPGHHHTLHRESPEKASIVRQDIIDWLVKRI